MILASGISTEDLIAMLALYGELVGGIVAFVALFFSRRVGRYLALSSFLLAAGAIAWWVHKNGGFSPGSLKRTPYSQIANALRSFGLYSIPAIAVFVLSFFPWLVDSPPGRCRKCGYRLKGLTAPRWPECGTPFSPDILQPPTTE